MERFNPNPETGLSAQQVRERVGEGLVNRSVKAESKSVSDIIKSNVFTYFNLIFAILAALLIFVGSFKSLTFLPVVLANLVIGIVQELRAKSVLDKLVVLSDPKAVVVRDGTVENILAEELVLDDIAVFNQGMQISADAIVVSGEVSVNEALLTGESVEVKKFPGDSLMSGSFVVSGECRARLEKVGAESYASQLTLAAKADRKKEQSEMIRMLNKLVGAVGIIIIPVGIMLFVQQRFFAHAGLKESVVSMVAAVIGMIPEGLYFLASVTLVVSMMRLAKQKVLLHDMKSIETLARVDVLCVDKTGTITGADMRVTEMVPLGSGAFEGSASKGSEESASKGSEDSANKGSEDSASKGSEGSAALEKLKSLISDFIAAMPEGNATNTALKAYFDAPSGITASSVQPFSSAYKYSSAVLGGQTYVIGAPEYIVSQDDVSVREQYEKYSSEGFRALVFAKYFGEADGSALEGKSEPLALILIENTIRSSSKSTFKFFADQGVRVKVISGDNPVTVSRIAGEVGIEGAERYIDATSLTTDEDFANAVREYNVFGRVKPDQKLKIVHALQAEGHTVGMTGDGVNDVLALKDADCSVAMASGCDAAVQVSQLVLLESDFAAMPQAVAEGRRVVNNIQRSASLFLVKNIFSLITALFSILFFLQYPLEPSQVSLIAAFTIGIPGFFLAMAPNYALIKGTFLRNVLSKALPAGIIDAIVVIAISVIGRSLGINQKEIATASTMLLAIVGFMVILRIVWKPRAWHIALLALCAAGTVLAALLFSNIFNMVAMSEKCIILFVLFAAATIPLLHFLTKLSDKLLAVEH